MLNVTEAALRKLGEVIRQQTESGVEIYGLRVMAQEGCCSGPRFGMQLASSPVEGDWQGEFGGVKVLIDQESVALLQGASIDYIETIQESGFTISNPTLQPKEKASGGCGCGGGGCGCGGHS